MSGAVAIQTPASVANDWATTQFMIAARISQMQTVALVTVESVTNAGGVSPVGRVDVRPLVNQQASDGTQVPHGVIYDIPYMRLQGGTDAVILDPKVGDIGVCLFASRDIQGVKADPQASIANGTPPSSAAQFSYADGLYLGGFLNGVPVQYIAFGAGGIALVSPTKVTIQAPEIDLIGAVVQTAGDVTMSGKLDVTGEVTGNGTHLHTHTHSGVTAGGSNTGPPTP